VTGVKKAGRARPTAGANGPLPPPPFCRSSIMLAGVALAAPQRAAIATALNFMVSVIAEVQKPQK
jgi:hypothetical protein